MRQRIKAADSDLSPERALEQLQRLQQHQIRINPSGKPINGISRPSETHNRVFAALNLKNLRSHSNSLYCSTMLYTFFELRFLTIKHLCV